MKSINKLNKNKKINPIGSNFIMLCFIFKRIKKYEMKKYKK